MASGSISKFHDLDPRAVVVARYVSPTEERAAYLQLNFGGADIYVNEKDENDALGRILAALKARSSDEPDFISENPRDTQYFYDKSKIVGFAGDTVLIEGRALAPFGVELDEIGFEAPIYEISSEREPYCLQNAGGTVTFYAHYADYIKISRIEGLKKSDRRRSLSADITVNPNSQKYSFTFDVTDHRHVQRMMDQLGFISVASGNDLHFIRPMALACVQSTIGDDVSSAELIFSNSCCTIDFDTEDGAEALARRLIDAGGLTIYAPFPQVIACAPFRVLAISVGTETDHRLRLPETYLEIKTNITHRARITRGEAGRLVKKLKLSCYHQHVETPTVTHFICDIVGIYASKAGSDTYIGVLENLNPVTSFVKLASGIAAKKHLFKKPKAGYFAINGIDEKFALIKEHCVASLNFFALKEESDRAYLRVTLTAGASFTTQVSLLEAERIISKIGRSSEFETYSTMMGTLLVRNDQIVGIMVTRQTDNADLGLVVLKHGITEATTGEIAKRAAAALNLPISTLKPAEKTEIRRKTRAA